MEAVNTKFKVVGLIRLIRLFDCTFNFSINCILVKMIHWSLFGMQVVLFLRLIAFQFRGHVSSLVSWDSSMHDSPLLNRVTPSGERVYLIIKVKKAFAQSGLKKYQIFIILAALRRNEWRYRVSISATLRLGNTASKSLAALVRFDRPRNRTTRPHALITMSSTTMPAVRCCNEKLCWHLVLYFSVRDMA